MRFQNLKKNIWLMVLVLEMKFAESYRFLSIYQKKQKILKIGNIYSKRDWGYAEDYIEAMWKMTQSKIPQDYVIATGKNHSVKQFINLVAVDLRDSY